jgi:hypothetical protein
VEPLLVVEVDVRVVVQVLERLLLACGFGDGFDDLGEVECGVAGWRYVEDDVLAEAEVVVDVFGEDWFVVVAGGFE